MNIVVRRAKIEDAEALNILNRDELGYDYPFVETRVKLERALQRGREAVFVAELNGIVIGYVHACGYDVLYAPHMKDIMGIAVSSAYRKMGIGAALLRAVEDWAKQSDAAGVRLVSGESRLDAHAFYRHCGYIDGKKQVNFKKKFGE